jgi:hypothetical protein
LARHVGRRQRTRILPMTPEHVGRHHLSRNWAYTALPEGGGFRINLYGGAFGDTSAYAAARIGIQMLNGAIQQLAQDVAKYDVLHTDRTGFRGHWTGT